MSAAADPSAYDFDALVRRYAVRTREAFRFLEEKGYRREYGAMGYGSDPGQLVPDRHPSWPWFSLARYSGPRLTFEFRFGDREIHLEAFFLVGPEKERFALWELPERLGGNPEGLSGAMWIIREAFLDETVDRLAAALRHSLPRFEALGEPEFLAIRSERGRRREREDREQRQRELEKARTQSAEAFHAGRFHDVSKQLEPFGPELDETDRKRMELARKRLAGQ